MGEETGCQVQIPPRVSEFERFISIVVAVTAVTAVAAVIPVFAVARQLIARLPRRRRCCTLVLADPVTWDEMSHVSAGGSV